MMKLREYQQILADQSFEQILDTLAPCITLTTGGGKTVIIADIVRQAMEKGMEVIIVAHRLKIVMQIAASIKKHLGFYPQIITRGYTSPLAPVTVAMVQTLCRRDEWINRLQGRLYIVDEAHHQYTTSYMKLKEKLKAKHLLGLTATPIKPNGSTILGPNQFTHLLLGPPPQWLMDQGYICRYDMYGSDEEIDTSGLRVQANGEFSEKEHEERVLAISGAVVPNWFEFNTRRESTICIGVTVRHAEQLARLYMEQGISAEVVTGKTPEAERDRSFKRFEQGELTVLVSVALIDEGLDIPNATCLQLPRHIGSVRLHRQLVGRVLRPSPGKEKAIIIDHGGSWKNEKIPLPHEDYHWPVRPRERGTAVRKANEFVQRDGLNKVVVTNMVETGSRMKLITPQIKKSSANFLAGMTAKERAEFLRNQNPIGSMVAKWEQAVIPNLLP